MEELLTSDAAQEDTELWMDYFGKCIREIYRFFSDPMRDPFWHFLDYTPPKEILHLFLSAVNLDGSNKSNSSVSNNFMEQKKEQKVISRSDLNYVPLYTVLEMLKDVVKNMYAFARGENIRDDATEYIKRVISWYIQLTERLSPLRSPGMRRGNEALENFISPRFAYAYKMFRIRLHLTDLMRYPSPKEGVSPPDLATIAGVAYTYIIKLIKTKKLSAFKDEAGKNWIIPTKDAIDWLITRPNCPRWVHDLPNIEPIRIEDFELKNDNL